MTHCLRLVSALFIGALSTAAPALSQQATIEALSFPQDSQGSRGWDVSNDGAVAGEVQTASGWRAFRWNPAGVGADLSSAFGPWGGARAISDDGSVVGGFAGIVGSPQSFRWTATGGTQFPLPLPSGWQTAGDGASGISGDGAFLVAGSQFDLGGNQSLYHATRWSLENGLEDLDGRSTPSLSSSALDASSDGSVVVGTATGLSSARAHAFRWTASAGMEDLGTIFSVDGDSTAFGVSSDGSVVVGESWAPNAVYHAFRWTSLNGMQDLDPNGNSRSRAYDVSADGRVIVGEQNEQAAVWIDGQLRPLGDLLAELGVDLAGWDFTGSVALGCSPDGRFVTGATGFYGSYQGFRVRLRSGNAAPALTTLEAKQVECTGGVNSVTLSTVVSDADPLDRLSVVWRVDGIVRRTEPDVASDTTCNFPFNYSDGPHIVTVEASDGIATTTKETTVTVVDTTAPVIVVAPTLTLSVDREKIFASSWRIPQPSVTDACDPAPAVFLDAPAHLPIGTTTVTWTVKDLSRNVATAKQRVKVVNTTPIANAGPAVRKTTKSKSAKATLDGTKSKDPDGQPLRFLWKAKGIHFVNAGVARPTATFPVGRTVVTLTVTDSAGAKSTDTTTVVVSRARRKSAVAADAYAQASTSRALKATRSPDADAARGLSLAAYAAALGALAGDEIVASGASHEEQAAYAQLRYRQFEIGAAAGEAFARSFASTGDQEALDAGIYALASSLYALRDLNP